MPSSLFVLFQALEIKYLSLVSRRAEPGETSGVLESIISGIEARSGKSSEPA